MKIVNQNNFIHKKVVLPADEKTNGKKGNAHTSKKRLKIPEG
jgi:hypothetical protein